MKPKPLNNKPPLSLRISNPIMVRLLQACDRTNNPYAPNKTAIVERGIELALQELRLKQKAKP